MKPASALEKGQQLFWMLVGAIHNSNQNGFGFQFIKNDYLLKNIKDTRGNNIHKWNHNRQNKQGSQHFKDHLSLLYVFFTIILYGRRCEKFALYLKSLI